MDECEYTSTCHLVIDGKSIWPDTDENRKLGRTTRVTLADGEAKRFGPDLKKLAKAEEAEEAKDAEVTHDKQVTETRTK